jgi:hypothetical protein
MAADPLAEFWQHTVTVERWTGEGAFGKTYDTAADVTGFVDDGQRLVAGPSGEQITSTARVFLPITTATVPVQSRVTLPAEFGGRPAEVVAVARHDGAGLPSHWEVALQ